MGDRSIESSRWVSKVGLYGTNRLKLGLFGLNCNNGMTMTKAPERWDASWTNNLRATLDAEAAGLEFVLPIGRWQGYKGETDTEGTTFETLTWAASLLASTKRISVCGTLHVRFINPIFAAKQIVTADQVGQGRFALNIVSGWNKDEFEMFGIELLPHDVRYDYTEEWVNICKRLWTEDEPFDHNGKWFQLKNVQGKPKPWGAEPPMLVSAGNSPAGRGFATRHVDCMFVTVFDLDKLPETVAPVRELSKSREKAVGIFGSGHVIARATSREAREFQHYIVHDMGDWVAAEHAAHIRTRGRETPQAVLHDLKARLISGLATYPLVGSYDEVASMLGRISDAGIDGMALGLVNYITELPHLTEGVVPRLERMGLRQPSHVRH
jgi:alkanesulfonate monooxygenase SsuD/methylene tetrahydromethanopterin reductase-like flavin-dependent oxidoreductase (luciferase family)